MRTRQEIEHAFTYHPPKNESEIMFYRFFRERVLAVALELFDVVPECPERTIALRHLEEAVMYANAGVARHGLTVKEQSDGI